MAPPLPFSHASGPFSLEIRPEGGRRWVRSGATHFPFFLSYFGPGIRGAAKFCRRILGYPSALRGTAS